MNSDVATFLDSGHCSFIQIAKRALLLLCFISLGGFNTQRNGLEKVDKIQYSSGIE